VGREDPDSGAERAEERPVVGPAGVETASRGEERRVVGDDQIRVLVERLVEDRRRQIDGDERAPAGARDPARRRHEEADVVPGLGELGGKLLLEGVEDHADAGHAQGGRA
jgi:hypothetical protein